MLMLNQADLPGSIPLFPLPGAILLPRARLPLHLFEPRYLQMFEDVLKTSQRVIGVVQPRNEEVDDEQLHSIGCAGRVTQFTETEDGRYMITLSGVSRFQIAKEVSGFSPYRNAEVNWANFHADFGPSESDPEFDRSKFMNSLKKFFGSHDLQTDWDSLKDAETEMQINSLSMLCPFEPEEKQALLEAPTLKERREILETLIDFSIRGGSAEETLQ